MAFLRLRVSLLLVEWQRAISTGQRKKFVSGGKRWEIG
jgi:hypothetical protein